MEVDLLGVFGLDMLKMLIWIVAVVVGVVMFFVHRNWYWPLFEAALTFFVASVGVAIYIVTRPTDPRWSVGQEPMLNAPELPGGPIVGGVTDPLNDFFGTMTGSVNDLFAIKNALFVATDFFVMAGWAILALIPAFILAQVLARRQKRREMKVLTDRVKRIEDALRPRPAR